MQIGFCDELKKMLARKRLELDDRQLELLYGHWALLSEANRAVNLTAITEENEAQEKHYLDSLMLLPHIQKEGAVLDIGSGAGFPGIPLAVALPDREVVLLEATEKRARFLTQVTERLNLDNVRIVNARAEKAAHNQEYRGQFAIVTARAVAAMPVLLEYALPFLQKDGVFLAMKGPSLPQEMAAAGNALSILGGELVAAIDYSLPNSGDRRSIAIVKQTGEIPEKYPRREGKPEKTPL